MKNLICFLATSVIIINTSICFSQTKADTLYILNIIEKESIAWNKGDAKAYSHYFADDGTFTNILGQFYTGYQDFLVRHEQIFNGVFKATTMNQTLVSLKFICPDAAVVETITVISGFTLNGPPKGTFPDENGNLRTRLLQVIVREGENWKIKAYHNVDIK